MNVMLVPWRSEDAPFFERALRHAALVGLCPLVAVAPDGELEALGERVDDGDADAVQPAGDLVAATVAELATRVKNGQHDLGCGLPLLLHRVDGDAAPVVGDRHARVGVDRDLDVVALAGERFVDRVVHDLVDEVVESARAGRPDVHTRALANGFETFEDGDVLGGVTLLLRLLALWRDSFLGRPSRLLQASSPSRSLRYCQTCGTPTQRRQKRGSGRSKLDI